MVNVSAPPRTVIDFDDGAMGFVDLSELIILSMITGPSESHQKALRVV
jgi:hypothetical protein